MMNFKYNQLGKYALVERLGSGGMAEVFKGFQPSIERTVAIKVMHKHLAAQDQFVERFRSEAKGVAQLRHHNIVRIIDFDVQDDLYYMVLDYIEGQTLRACLKKHGILDPCQALYIVAQLADALAYAHQRGIIHRDIKPGNIMFMDDSFCSPVLTDFGLVRILSDDGMTMTGAMIGTPAYMSPEALRGEKVDGRADIYSLGVVLYEMVLGRTPYTAESPYGMMVKQLHEPLPAPRELNPDLPKVVETLILKAMAKELPQRFQSAEEFRQAIQEAFAYLNDGQSLSFSLSMRLTPTFPLLRQRCVTPKSFSMRRFASLGAAFGGSLLVAFFMVQLLLGGHRSGKVQNTGAMVKASVENVTSPSAFEHGVPDLTATVLLATATMAAEEPLHPSEEVFAPEAAQDVTATIPAQVMPAPATAILIEFSEEVPAVIPTEATPLSEMLVAVTQTLPEVPTVMPSEQPPLPSPSATMMPIPALATAMPTERSQDRMTSLPTATETLPDAAMVIPTEPPAATMTAIPQPTEPPAATMTAIPQPTEPPAATAIPQPTEPPAATMTAIPQPTEPPAATMTAIPQPAEPPAATMTAIPQPAEPPAATMTAIPQPAEPPAATMTAILQPYPGYNPTPRPNHATPTSQNSEGVEDNEEQTSPDDDDQGQNQDDHGGNNNDQGGNSGTNAQEEKPDEVKPDEVKPDEEKPDEVKPDEVNPDEEKPDEEKPDEEKPDEEKPDEEKPDEEKSDEVKPDDVKPDEVKPDEVKNNKDKGNKDKKD